MKFFQEIYFAFLRLRNELDYPLRKRLSFRSSPVFNSQPEVKNVLDSYPVEDRKRIEEIITRLNNQYHFLYFSTSHTLNEIRENYYYLSMLDEAFQRSDLILAESIEAADIGPSSWFYVHALSAALGWFGQSTQRNFHLSGFEIDAYRLYSDFHTRKDHALGNMKGLSGIVYLDHGFEEATCAYDVITLFFPFVFEKDHLEWGLPQRLFEPGELLKAAWNSLRPGGLLLIVNQGFNEHQKELSLMKDLNIPICTAFQVEPLLYSYAFDRFIITAKHP